MLTIMQISSGKKLIGVIGSRKASLRELVRSYNFAKEIVGKGNIVVSGLAKGIDAYAHQGALDTGGQTLAFVNTEPKQPLYPKENRELGERIKNIGGVIHPFPNGFKNIVNSRFTEFERRLLERDYLIVEICEEIYAVSDHEIITGGTRYATAWAKEIGKKVYRLDSNGDLHKNPPTASINIDWTFQLNLTKEKEKWLNILYRR